MTDWALTAQSHAFGHYCTCITRLSKRLLHGAAPAVSKVELHMQAFYAVQINFRLEGERHAKNYFQLIITYHEDFHIGDMWQMQIY